MWQGFCGHGAISTLLRMVTTINKTTLLFAPVDIKACPTAEPPLHHTSMTPASNALTTLSSRQLMWTYTYTWEAACKSKLSWDLFPGCAGIFSHIHCMLQAISGNSTVWVILATRGEFIAGQCSTTPPGMYARIYFCTHFNGKQLHCCVFSMH